MSNPISTTASTPVVVVISSYLEPEHIARIRAVDARLQVIDAPELLPTPRYPCDHVGAPRTLTADEEQSRRAHMASAEVMFDFDYVRRSELPQLAPNLRWLQATSAGIGQFVKRMGYDQTLPHTRFTTASGVHAVPLAEFCIMSMLNHYRGLATMQADQRARRWERFATTDLPGKTVAIIGLGNIGREIARLSSAFGLRVIGSRTAVSPMANVAHVYAPGELHAMLAEADTVIMTTPHTPATDRMLGAAEFAAMRDGAFFINIGRGATVDEPALIAALHSGKLGGAALDVFAEEPLPAESPLWDMPNVLVCPHSASTSAQENVRLTDLFCDNLRRYLDGDPLRNVLDTERLY
ncbi:MAG: D-2-hydroxyacid dehydrogenase [Caldilineaceae bacterium]